MWMARDGYLEEKTLGIYLYLLFSLMSAYMPGLLHTVIFLGRHGTISQVSGTPTIFYIE